MRWRVEKGDVLGWTTSNTTLLDVHSADVVAYDKLVNICSYILTGY